MYAVIAIEQSGESEWSRHKTVEAAKKAVRRYKKANPDNAHWVDHYGYRIDKVNE